MKTLLGMIAAIVAATAQTIPLDPAALKAANAKAERVTWKGREAVRLIDTGADNLGDGLRLAIIPGVEFQDGVLEVDLAGDTKPNAPPLSRGFTGVAFHINPDASRFECFYLRPKNGRAEDQEQRNHSAQYISVPDFPWQKLRSETPSKYESYVDLVPGEWTKVKIEVHGVKARLSVNGAAQPVLLVNDLKLGASKGGVALWVGPGTVAHFANLKVTH